jgi:transposase
MMEGLVGQFSGLKISKTALYQFVTERCQISLKRAHFHSIERNSPEKIEERYQWVKQWENTDIDYESNCVFIDEAGFHINMKRSMAWSKKGERANVETPSTRGKTTTIIGAISPYGVVNVKVKTPRVVAPSKKRKAASGVSTVIGKGKGGTVTGHYFNFIAATLDVMDKHEIFKGHYLVMDNAPIHKHIAIRQYIESRGYGCVYLPPYSPELNPIEQFWSVCKSKLKRERLLEEETLATRIQDACNSVLVSDLRGFCKYSVDRFADCLERRPL